MLTITDIQKEIRASGADAWIMVDYENHNPALVRFLGQRMLTRKIFLVIPAESKPYLITHAIDTVYLKDEDILSRFDLKVYKTWAEMLDWERKLFSPYKAVLMDVSESGLLPRVSLADYGSVSFVESLEIRILPSADLLQHLTAVMDEKALNSQINACKTCLSIKDEAFSFIAKRIRENGESSELEVQQFIARRFTEEGMVFDEAPSWRLVPMPPTPTTPRPSKSIPRFEKAIWSLSTCGPSIKKRVASTRTSPGWAMSGPIFPKSMWIVSTS